MTIKITGKYIEILCPKCNSSISIELLKETELKDFECPICGLRIKNE